MQHKNMGEEDLIKKLEKISVPEIEIPSHRARLRAVLLKKHSEERKKRRTFDVFWRLAPLPLGLVTILLVVAIFGNLLSPDYSLAEIEDMAMKDPQVRKLVENGAAIREVKIIKNRAYVLVQGGEISEGSQSKQMEGSSAPASASFRKETKNKGTEAVVAEINLKNKEVTKVKNFSVSVPQLTENELERIREISENSDEIKKIIPKEAEIQSIEGLPSEFELKKSGDSVRIEIKTTDKKEAVIRYKFDSSQAEARINLEEERVESVATSSAPER